MKSFIENTIKSIARLVVSLLTVSWTAYKIESIRQEILSKIQEFINSGKLCLPLRFIKAVYDKIITKQPVTEIESVSEDSVNGDVIMKTKKSLSFFKVILIIGILIAVAIYILDRILPKPYTDEDLDEAWQNDDDFETDNNSNHPPTADVTYDVNKEDESEKDETSRKTDKEEKNEDK